MTSAIERLLGSGGARRIGPGDPDAHGLIESDALAVQPRDAEQCAALLRVAAESGLRVFPIGGGTHLAACAPPAHVDVLLDTRAMAGIVAHDAADQTIAVRAGTPLAAIDAAARAERQFLPVDALDRAATAGGVVAAAACGPLAAGYGPPKDRLLGAHAAHPDGTVTKSGGRLVKNVTGFDLHRLYHGSRGALAVLTEVCFRLAPIPERDATLVAGCPDLAALDRFVAAWRDPRAGVAAVAHVAAERSLLPADLVAAAGGSAFAIALRFHGRSAALDVAIGRARGLAGSAASAVLEDVDAESAWRALGCASAAGGDGAIVRVSVLPMHGAASTLGSAIAALLAAAEASGPRPRIVVEPDRGIVRARFEHVPADRFFADLAARVARLPSVARVTVDSAPVAWRRGNDARFGRAPDTPIAQRVKRALDPRGTLVGGLA